MELKKRLEYPYRWGRKQSDTWDGATNFIYQTYDFETLLRKTENMEQKLKDYALNRWYNFWSAMAVENIFASHNNVTANKNSFDKLVDFTINGIPFDHKTSVFPKGFNKSFEYARKNKKQLIQWLYNNQSQQGRKHFKNRLFIIVYDKIGEHWKMKSEIMLLKRHIDFYLENFNENKLTSLKFNNEKIYSDILWITNI